MICDRRNFIRLASGFLPVCFGMSPLSLLHFTENRSGARQPVVPDLVTYQNLVRPYLRRLVLWMEEWHFREYYWKDKCVLDLEKLGLFVPDFTPELSKFESFLRTGRLPVGTRDIDRVCATLGALVIQETGLPPCANALSYPLEAVGAALHKVHSSPQCALPLLPIQPISIPEPDCEEWWHWN